MTVSVGDRALKAASVGTQSLKQIFIGGARVWAKIRTITFNRDTDTLGKTTIIEKHYRSGDKSLIAEWLSSGVKFAAPVIADNTVRAGRNRVNAGVVIPAGVNVKRWVDSELTFTEVI